MHHDKDRARLLTYLNRSMARASALFTFVIEVWFFGLIEKQMSARVSP